jgi:hypothetical protein
MFELSTADANPSAANKWIALAGVTTATTGAVSLATIIDRIKVIFPAKVLELLPNYQQYIYLALALAFITALPITFVKKVICLSLAELGFVSSLLYLSCALFGVFANGFEKIVLVVALLMILVFLVIFSSGFSYEIHEQKWSDFGLELAMLLIFLGIWLYPLIKIWRRV